MSKTGLVRALVLMATLTWQTSSFGADRAAFERSIAGLVQGVNVRAHPNPIAYLGAIGEYYCRLKGQQRRSLDVQEATSALRKAAQPALIPTTADETMVVSAAMAEAQKLLCP